MGNTTQGCINCGRFISGTGIDNSTFCDKGCKKVFKLRTQGAVNQVIVKPINLN